MQRQEDRNQDATVYVGNIDDRATDALIWELFLQAGPVANVHMPRDRVTQMHQGYGFVEFLTEEDAEYAMKIMNMVKLFGKPLRVNKATSDKQNLDIGATLFIGNLDPLVDEKALFDTFSAFGVITLTPKISRDLDTGASKGYGFVSFSTFEASDAAIDAMNGQFLANRQITVSYALKKDGKGERHGSAAERLIAAQSAKMGIAPQMPNRNFADIPVMPPPSQQLAFGQTGMPPVFLPPIPAGFAMPPMQGQWNNPQTGR
eukprot:jgi/Hompol1/2288/HPOL_002143-RA